MKRFIVEARAGMSTTPKGWSFDIGLSVTFVALFTLNMWPSAYDNAPEHALLIAASAATALILVMAPFAWRERARFEAAVADANLDADPEGPTP